MKLLKMLFTFLFIISISVKVLSQDADEIVNKYVNAKGGLEKLQAIKTIQLKGNVITAKMEIPFTQTFKRPSKVLMESNYQGTIMKQAFNGTHGWVLNPFLGKKDPEFMSKDMENTIKKSTEFEGELVNYKNKGSKIELLGKEELNGNQVYKIKLTEISNETTYFYINANSYLIEKYNQRINYDKLDISAEIIFSNYKRINGVMFPFMTELKSSSNPIGNSKIVTNTIEINIPIQDSIFEMPVSK
jgi:hypothetical protein